MEFPLYADWISPLKISSAFLISGSFLKTVIGSPDGAAFSSAASGKSARHRRAFPSGSRFRVRQAPRECPREISGCSGASANLSPVPGFFPNATTHASPSMRNSFIASIHALMSGRSWRTRCSSPGHKSASPVAGFGCSSFFRLGRWRRFAARGRPGSRGGRRLAAAQCGERVDHFRQGRLSERLHGFDDSDLEMHLLVRRPFHPRFSLRKLLDQLPPPPRQRAGVGVPPRRRQRLALRSGLVGGVFFWVF